jgi:hypothetical protein
VERSSIRLVSCFELLRTESAKMTVAPRSIVEGIDVVGYVGDRQFPVPVDLFLDPLFLQAAEKGLGDGIVPAVGFPAHARFKVIRAAESPPGVAAILRALIGMNQRAPRPASANGHQDGIQYQLAVNGRPGSPPDDQPREEIHDDGQIEPALPRADVRDVRHPGRIGACRGKSTLQEIRNEQRWLPDGPAANAVPMQRSEIGLAHQPLHAMLTAGLARFTEIEEDSRRSVDAMARDIRGTNEAQQPGVFLSTIGDGLLQPVVVAALGDLEDATHLLDAELISMRLNEFIGRANAPRDQVLRLRHRPSQTPDANASPLNPGNSIKKDKMLVTKGARENRHRPGIDPLFARPAVAHGARVIGVVLTGMLDDGTAGLMAIKRCGSVTVVQDPRDAAYSGMPVNALNNVDVDFCVAVAEMGPLLTTLVSQPHGKSKAVPSDIRTDAVIAERVLSDVSQVNGLGDQVLPYNCPECGGVLWEMDTPGEKRYRCHTGHSYTAPALVCESV